MLERFYREAISFESFLETAEQLRELWIKLSHRARVPPEAVARVEALGGRWRLLVLSEDWCGDAVNTVPVLAALADAAENLELRMLERDEHPELMDAHLTGTSRSIPVVMVLDEEYEEHGWWGPRPRELQTWAVGEGKLLPPEEKYRRIRTWYARDQGRATVDEVVSLLERAAAERREMVR